MLDRRLQLASSPEERCVEFLIYVACQSLSASFSSFSSSSSTSSSSSSSSSTSSLPSFSSSLPSSPPLLCILQATLATCVKQYCMYDLASWRRAERGSPKSLMTSLSGGWVTTFTPWLTAAHNHNSLLLSGRYTHFVLIKLYFEPLKCRHLILTDILLRYGPKTLNVSSFERLCYYCNV